MPPREFITRRCLPHWYVPGAAHFVTYRLFGTLPRSVLDDIQTRRKLLLARKPAKGCTARQHRERVHKQLFAVYDGWLDRGEAINYLADPRVAAMIRESLYHHDGNMYQLLAYCIMSNHVHVLLIPKDTDVEASRLHHDTDASVGELPDKNSPLAKIMHSLKSYTAHEANRILNRTGAFWQFESYDHWVRDEHELERIVDYIANNPVKANRVKRPHHAFFSSCQDRYLTDGEVSGWLLWNR